MWAISGWYWAWTEISIGGQRFGVRVSQGVVWLEYSSVPLPAAWGEPTKHYLGPAQAAGFPRWRWGFYASVARYPSGGETSTLVVPLWFVALLAAAPIGWRWHRDRRERLGRGHCPKCGYDLVGLAAGAVCPECGGMLAGCKASGEGE